MRLIHPTDLDIAARAIEAGELVIVPTKRWYMICADAGNPDACKRIFDGKKRPPGKSLAFVLPSLEACEQRFQLTPEARRLADAFWPGDLALLLPWRDPADAAGYTAVGSPALTTYDSGLLGRLASLSTAPVAATTVNISGDAGPDDPGPAITLDEVNHFLTTTGVGASVIVDGGICPAANHMTIVDCFTPEARLVRTGLVHQRAISAALGRDVRGT
ncbi:L-threonylcarbamoyladenylate synthase [Streptomyces turgidiscabies]|uniref:L-threonylcarbamoyladenylate synthase n=1 Tax=Streptomyces turgidiscabies TaxID=85558 RepID=UPI0038F6D87E